MVRTPDREAEENAYSRGVNKVNVNNLGGRQTRIPITELIFGDSVEWSSGITMTYHGARQNEAFSRKELKFSHEMGSGQTRMLYVAERAIGVNDEGRLFYKTGKPNVMLWSEEIISGGNI